MKPNTFYLSPSLECFPSSAWKCLHVGRRESFPRRADRKHFSVTRLNRVVRAFVLPSIPFPEVSTISRGWRRLSARMFVKTVRNPISGAVVCRIFIFLVVLLECEVAVGAKEFHHKNVGISERDGNVIDICQSKRISSEIFEPFKLILRGSKDQY